MRTRFFRDGALVGDMHGIHGVDSIAAPEGQDGYTVEHYLHVDDVRAEASRRMQIAFGARDAKHLEMVIANANREAIRLLRLGAANWSTEEATRAAQLEGADKLLEAIRVASNKLEPLDPIPDDYADDKHWP